MSNKSTELGSDTFSCEIYFPTMIFNINCSKSDELNASLLQQIYSERERDSNGISRSNFKKLGGWHSHSMLHKEDGYSPLLTKIELAADRISSKLGYHKDLSLRVGTMWSIVNPPGCLNKVHIHPGSLWSGVYYVNAPDSCGDIEFTDPRTAYIMNQPKFDSRSQRPKENWTKVRFTPRAGKMLIFPSWLYHGVEPNLTTLTGKDADRVIISFNLSQSPTKSSTTK